MPWGQKPPPPPPPSFMDRRVKPVVEGCKSQAAAMKERMQRWSKDPAARRNAAVVAGVIVVAKAVSGAMRGKGGHASVGLKGWLKGRGGAGVWWDGPCARPWFGS